MGRSPSASVALGRPRGTPVRAEDDMPRGDLAAFCARLGITTDVLGPARPYLLVTASARPGARRVVSLFSTEADARAAFVRFRRAEPGEGPWAELAELSASGAVRRMCWFGPDTRSSTQSPPAGRGPRHGLRSALLRRVRRLNARAR